MYQTSISISSTIILFLTTILCATLLLFSTTTQSMTIPKFGCKCADVHVISVRASGEPPGEGIIGLVASAIQASTTKTVSRDSVRYPATLSDYLTSSAAGVVALKTQLEDQVEKCPGQKIVLLGYSQGAQVVGDVLSGGGGGDLGNETRPESFEVGKHVAAAIIMGDPRHVPGEPFQRGTTITDTISKGVFPRLDKQEDVLVKHYGSKILSYCDAKDKYCARPGNSTIVHATYVFRYKIPAVKFVLKKLGHTEDESQLVVMEPDSYNWY